MPSGHMRIGFALLLPLALCLRPQDAVAAPADSSAAARDPHAVQPERPTVATHAYCVAPGWLEVEAGAEFDRDAPEEFGLSVPMTVKLGLARGLQLTASDPVTRPVGVHAGIGDLNVGIKCHVLDGAPIVRDFALLPSVKFPSGSVSKGEGTGTTDFTLIAISSRTLGTTELDMNLGATVRSGNGDAAPKTATLWTVAAGVPVTGPLGLALEMYGYPGTAGPAGQAPVVAVLAGPTFLARSWLELDVGVAAALTGPQPTALYGGGVVNIGRLWGPQP
jgi:hypothetical protein